MIQWLVKVFVFQSKMYFWKKKGAVWRVKKNGIVMLTQRVCQIYLRELKLAWTYIYKNLFLLLNCNSTPYMSPYHLTHCDILQGHQANSVYIPPCFSTFFFLVYKFQNRSYNKFRNSHFVYSWSCHSIFTFLM